MHQWRLPRRGANARGQPPRRCRHKEEFVHVHESVLAVLITASGTTTATATGHRSARSWGHGRYTTSSGKVPVTRSYEAIAANQHLLVTDRVASEQPWEW